MFALWFVILNKFKTRAQVLLEGGENDAEQEPEKLINNYFILFLMNNYLLSY